MPLAAQSTDVEIRDEAEQSILRNIDAIMEALALAIYEKINSSVLEHSSDESTEAYSQPEDNCIGNPRYAADEVSSSVSQAGYNTSVPGLTNLGVNTTDCLTSENYVLNDKDFESDQVGEYVVQNDQVFESGQVVREYDVLNDQVFESDHVVREYDEMSEQTAAINSIYLQEIDSWREPLSSLVAEISMGPGVNLEFDVMDKEDIISALRLPEKHLNAQLNVDTGLSTEKLSSSGTETHEELQVYKNVCKLSNVFIGQNVSAAIKPDEEKIIQSQLINFGTSSAPTKQEIVDNCKTEITDESGLADVEVFVVTKEKCINDSGDCSQSLVQPQSQAFTVAGTVERQLVYEDDDDDQKFLSDWTGALNVDKFLAKKNIEPRKQIWRLMPAQICRVQEGSCSSNKNDSNRRNNSRNRSLDEDNIFDLVKSPTDMSATTCLQDLDHLISHNNISHIKSSGQETITQSDITTRKKSKEFHNAEKKDKSLEVVPRKRRKLAFTHNLVNASKEKAENGKIVNRKIQQEMLDLTCKRKNEIKHKSQNTNVSYNVRNTLTQYSEDGQCKVKDCSKRKQNTRFTNKSSEQIVSGSKSEGSDFSLRSTAKRKERIEAMSCISKRFCDRLRPADKGNNKTSNRSEEIVSGSKSQIVNCSKSEGSNFNLRSTAKRKERIEAMNCTSKRFCDRLRPADKWNKKNKRTEQIVNGSKSEDSDFSLRSTAKRKERIEARSCTSKRFCDRLGPADKGNKKNERSEQIVTGSKSEGSDFSLRSTAKSKEIIEARSCTSKRFCDKLRPTDKGNNKTKNSLNIGNVCGRNTLNKKPKHRWKETMYNSREKEDILKLRRCRTFRNMETSSKTKISKSVFQKCTKQSSNASSSSSSPSSSVALKHDKMQSEYKTLKLTSGSRKAKQDISKPVTQKAESMEIGLACMNNSYRLKSTFKCKAHMLSTTTRSCFMRDKRNREVKCCICKRQTVSKENIAPLPHSNRLAKTIRKNRKDYICYPQMSNSCTAGTQSFKTIKHSGNTKDPERKRDQASKGTEKQTVYAKAMDKITHSRNTRDPERKRDQASKGTEKQSVYVKAMDKSTHTGNTKDPGRKSQVISTWMKVQTVCTRAMQKSRHSIRIKNPEKTNHVIYNGTENHTQLLRPDKCPRIYRKFTAVRAVSRPLLNKKLTSSAQSNSTIYPKYQATGKTSQTNDARNILEHTVRYPMVVLHDMTLNNP